MCNLLGEWMMGVVSQKTEAVSFTDEVFVHMACLYIKTQTMDNYVNVI